MSGRMRRLGCVVAVLAVTHLGVAAAAEKPVREKTPVVGKQSEEKKPAETGNADRAVETYTSDDAIVEVIGQPAEGCCASPKLVPVCRCVPTVKKKPKTEYDVKCELVCVPGCGSHLCGKRHGGCAGGCSDGCCDATPCDRATIRPKKTLLKKVVDEEEDAWEYKVEWVCAACATGCCSPGVGCCSPEDCEDGSHLLTGHGRSRSRFNGLWRGLFDWK